MKVYLTGGDPGGINYEIILKGFMALKDKPYINQIVPILSRKALHYWQKYYSLELPLHIHNNTLFIEDVFPSFDVNFSIASISQINGDMALKSLNFATQSVLKNPHSDVLFTMPVHKKSISLAGITHFTGHTEYLADLTKTDHVTMVLVNQSIAVALVTTHLPLFKVSENISVEKIQQICQQFHQFVLSKDENATLWICSLNPHSGDNGLLGHEEEEVIIPSIKQLKKIMNIEGPYASDTLFKKALSKEAHFFVAMYHDQGLIPIKLLGYDEIVNITLGLPFFRISVGHGTAFDITSQNKANLNSFFTAIKWIFNK